MFIQQSRRTDFTDDTLTAIYHLLRRSHWPPTYEAGMQDPVIVSIVRDHAIRSQREAQQRRQLEMHPLPGGDHQPKPKGDTRGET